jgi:hypothetical protein
MTNVYKNIYHTSSFLRLPARRRGSRNPDIFFNSSPGAGLDSGLHGNENLNILLQIQFLCFLRGQQTMDN